MDLALKDRVILITGGAKGIGAAIVRSCANEGGIPVILDCDEVAIRQLQTELRQKNHRSEAITVDLNDSERASRAAEDVARTFGHLDGLVNNAGINDGVGLEHGSPERFAASLKDNLVHYYTITQTTLPFLKQSQGSIVNMASKVAITGQGGTSGYAAAKGAILELTSEWAIELSSYGIRVNAVVPAEVMTSQYETWLTKFADPQEKRRSITSKIPLGQRMTEADEIAAMTTFLLSRKSGGMTGQLLFVDGGYVHLDRRLP